MENDNEENDIDSTWMELANRVHFEENDENEVSNDGNEEVVNVAPPDNEETQPSSDAHYIEISQDDEADNEETEIDDDKPETVNTILNASSLMWKFGASMFRGAQLGDARVFTRFLNWNRWELVELLVSEGIEIRGESSISYSWLLEKADETFESRNMPDKPVPPEPGVLAIRKILARKIQTLWVKHHDIGAQKLKKLMEEDEKGIEDDDADLVEIFDYSQLLGAPPSYNEVYGGEAPLDSSITNETSPVASVETVAENDQTDTVAVSIETNDGKNAQLNSQALKKLNYLDSPWVPPSWEKAAVYSSYVHPRKGGKGGKEFSIATTTTGRYCCIGSFGEQFDLWKEGQASEFAEFGPGL